MDTIPFHFIMFALDVVLLLGIAWWPVHTFSRTFLGWALFGFFGLLGIAVAAIVFRTNLGQCAVEGLTYHGSAFLIISGIIFAVKGQRTFGIGSALFGLCIFAIGLDMLVIEPNRLVVEHYEIETDKVKTPVRIAFVTDIQTDRIGPYERRTFRTIMEQKADIIILGGDYLQYYPGTFGTEDLPDRFRELFKEIPLTAPLGVYAVHGNIDLAHPYEFRDFFQDTGVEPVHGSTFFEYLGSDQDKGPIDLAILGMIDSIDGVGERGLTDTGNFLVMVGHYPNYAIKDYQNAKKTPDLMLAGHTHGGQIALPFYGPIRVKFLHREDVISRKFLRGMKFFPSGGQLLISRGSGVERGWAPRVRFLCPPEISVIDIVPKNTPSQP